MVASIILSPILGMTSSKCVIRIFLSVIIGAKIQGISLKKFLNQCNK